MSQTDQPENLKYAETHEWVRVEGDEAFIGISDYAQDELGEVVFLELPWDDVGAAQFKAGDRFGEIESVKATSELFAPVSGTLARVHETLKDMDKLEAINKDPYGQGWMLAIRMSDPSELDKLMDAAAYTKFLETAGH